MRDVRKSLNLISLIVFVCVNILSPFSYAQLEDFSVQEDNSTEIEETISVDEPDDEVEDEKSSKK